MTAAPAAVAIEPVAARLRRDAEEKAAALRSAAHAEAAEILEQARRDAAAALGEAAATAGAMAAPLTAAELVRARDGARSAVLTAQREAADELRGRVRAAVAALPGQPGYDRLSQGLANLAEQAAGPGAQLGPTPDGGVVARCPGVIVDCSLGRLADLGVTELGAAIRELWVP